MMRANALALSLGLAWLFAPRAAAACSITVTPLSFGLYDVFDAAPLDSIGRIVWSCPEGTPAARISIAGTPRERALRSATDRLRYSLFLDAARTRLWGDGTAGSEVFTGAPPRDSGTLIIYGRVPPRQNVTPGVYSDQVMVLIDF